MTATLERTLDELESFYGEQVADCPTDPDFATLTRAYLSLQRHGRSSCKRSNPKCSACPVADRCAYFAVTARRRRRRRIGVA